MEAISDDNSVLERIGELEQLQAEADYVNYTDEFLEAVNVSLDF